MDNKGKDQALKEQAINEYIDSVAMAESSGGRFTSNPNSSAKGTYQFTDRTWKEVEKKIGRKLNINSSTDQRLAMKKLTEMNADALERNGLPITNANLYTTHVLGVSGGPKFLKKVRENPNELASKYASADAVKANPGLFLKDDKPVTASELYNTLSGKVKQTNSNEPVQKRIPIPEFNKTEIDRTSTPKPRINPNAKLVTQNELNGLSETYKGVDEERQALGLAGPTDFLTSNIGLIDDEESELTPDNENTETNMAKNGGPQEVSKSINPVEHYATKKIVKYQPGVTHHEMGRGFYLYSKDPNAPGFNYDTDREFVKQNGMMDLQRTPQWKEYMKSLEKNNNNNQIVQLKDGGTLNKSNNDNPDLNLLTEFNEGGSHEENKFGGIPLGIGPNGLPNTVEEGETKTKDDYVLSDALKVNENDASDLFLDPKIVGMTFAEASKYLNRLHDSNPFDKIVQKTAKKQLDALTLGNEKARINKEELDSNLEIDNNLDNQNQMFLGGDENEYYKNNSTFFSNDRQNINSNYTEPATKANTISSVEDPEESNSLLSGAKEKLGKASGIASGLLPAVPGVLDIGNDIFGSSKVNTDGIQSVNVQKDTAQVLPGAMKGMQTGAAIGSVIPGAGTLAGAGVGAAVGAIGGLIMGGKNRRKQIANNNNYAIKQNKLYDDNYEMGGKLKRGNKYDDGGNMNLPETYSDFRKKQPWFPNGDFAQLQNTWDNNKDGIPDSLQIQKFPKPSLSGQDESFDTSGLVKKDEPFYESDLTLDDLEKRAAVEQRFQTKGKSPLQYAPVLGDMLGYLDAKNDRPDYIAPTTISKRATRNYVDENRLLNQIESGNSDVIEGLTNASGGSAAALRANILGANAQNKMNISDAFMRIDDSNKATDSRADQLDFSTDTFNIGQMDNSEQFNLSSKAAQKDAERAARDAIFSDLGAIGKEQTYDNRLYNITGGYDSSGKYIPEFYKEEEKKNKGRNGGALEQFSEIMFDNPGVEIERKIKSIYNR